MSIKAQIANLNHPRVRPLEIEMLPGQCGSLVRHTLREQSGHRHLGPLLRAVIENLPSVPHGHEFRIGSIYLAGGRAVKLGGSLDAAAEKLPTLLISDAGLFAAEAGALALAGALLDRTLFCDLGQTHLKITWAGRRFVFPRNFSFLPPATGSEHSQRIRSQRKALRTFIGSRLRGVLEMAASDHRPTQLVMALPSAIDSMGTPAGSSYIGMAGDKLLVPDVLRDSLPQVVTVWLCNDAVLAAHSAIADERLSAAQGDVLVVTLGYAIGGAVILAGSTGAA